MARPEIKGEHNVIGCEQQVIFFVDPELIDPDEQTLVSTPCESGDKKRTITNIFDEGMYLQVEGCEACPFHKKG